MKRPFLLLLLLAFSFGLVGCSPAALKAAPGDAARLGGELHQRIDEEQWDDIYAEADPKYKEAVEEEKSQALLQAIHRKLGNMTKITMDTWQIQTTTSGTFLRASFSTTYSTGATSRDSFVWRKDASTYRLVNWNINSEALILK